MKTQELVLSMMLKGWITEPEAERARRAMELNPTLIALRILLKGNPEKQDFIDTLVWVRELRDMAAETLLAGELTNYELYLVAFYCEAHRRTAWDRLLKRGMTNAELLRIIETVSELQEEALEQLISQSPTQDELIKIIELRREKLFPRIWEVLRELANEEGLVRIYKMQRGRWDDTLHIQVAERLLEMGCGTGALVEVSYIVGRTQIPVTDVDWSLNTRAVERLLELGATLGELEAVVQLASQEHKERICERFIQSKEHRVHYLIKVVEHSEVLRQQAAETLMAWEGLDHNQERWVTVAVAIHYQPLRRKAWNRFLAGKPTTEQLDELMYMAHKAKADASFIGLVAQKVLEAPRPSHWARDSRNEADVIRLIKREYPDLVRQATRPVVRRQSARQ